MGEMIHSPAHDLRRWRTLCETIAYPKIVTSSFVDQYVMKMHRNEADFEEGDLLHRIDKFDHYVLHAVPIASVNLDEWSVDPDLVAQFSAMQTESPPIIFDAMDGSIIDGIHRANAAASQGRTEVLAYVGDAEHLNPNWYENQDSDEEDGDE